ncbi:cell envelope biogenesis protein OmpA [Flavobacterium album]|uniref:Cell envelope biogenesis protein OmpA n=1 Tax=Flavobacterium album TaxID=2175091 RepID=A0A2S1R0Z5_9FLAO|nr:OmpA family protein [Flavobacterium album]AWH86373.1 cell envelope biogenesis protein OmpA [Flavobacterium album]
MKKIYITLSFMLATMAVTAQDNKDLEAADKLYARYEYVDAAKAYEKLDKKDPYVYAQIADSYYNVFNSKEAVKWYPKAIEGSTDAEIYWRYAQMLKAEGKYEEANAQMQKFASMAPGDTRAVEFKKDPNYLPKLRNQAKLFDEKVLDINDKKYGSFGAVLSDDNTLYFTSARNTSRRNYGWSEEPFLDMYTATYNANGTYSEPALLPEVNSRYHDGPASVTADGNTMYFSSESFKERKEYERDRENNLKLGQVWLFRAKKVNGKWGDIEPVPFNNKMWSTGNPAISKDGKTLYFSSDREGTMGGNDIWKVEVNGDSYGEPVNLGPKVNTTGRESFPFITDDNKLYFSSDGHKGFGSLDVFMIDLNKGTDAINVGAPVNGPKDDFAFTFNTKNNIGFFSSNRDGFDKIYSATPLCAVEAIVQVRDKKTLQALPGAKVAILDEKNNVIETRTADAKGMVTYTVDCNRAYGLQGSMEKYSNGTAKVPAGKGPQANVNLDLDPIVVVPDQPVIVLDDVFFEFNKSNITKEGAFVLDNLVETMKKYPELVIMVKSHTDNRGSDKYNMALSNRRAKSTVQYVISKGIAKARISGEGYGESQPKVDCGANCTEEQYAQNRRSEFIIVKK